MRVNFPWFSPALGIALLFAAGCGNDSPRQDVAKTDLIGEKAEPTPPAKLAPAISAHKTLAAALSALEAKPVLDDTNILVKIEKLENVSDADVKILQQYATTELASLQELRLNGRHVTDVALAYLRDFQKLERLDASGTAITGKGLADLAALKQLRSLNLSQGVKWYEGLGPIPGTGKAVHIDWRPEPRYEPTYPYGPRGGVYYRENPQPQISMSMEPAKLKHLAVTDADFASIAKLKQLVELNLANTLLTDAGLIHLEQLTNLQILDLSGTVVTGRGLAFLPSELRELNLKDAQVTYEMLMSPNDWPFTKLQVLDLSGNAITDVGFAKLTKLSELKTLHLDANPLDDTAVLQLEMLPQLEELTLRDTKITAAGIERLRRTLPKCNIEWRATPGKPNSN